MVIDQEALRQFVKTHPDKYGRKIEEAGDPRQAVKQLREEDSDLLILDTVIPSIDGWGVLKAVKSNPKGRAPVITLISMNHDAYSDGQGGDTLSAFRTKFV